MILSINPVSTGFLPVARKSSRAEPSVTQAESSQVSAVHDINKPESQSSSTGRVNPANDSGNIESKQPDNIALSEGDRHVLQQLKARDREVRAHEAAHLAAAGSHATSGASFSYQRGPDGQLYAIGGEVGVSLGKVSGDPQATLDKAEQIRAAALAPSQPSSQDQAIAARASQLAAEARRDIAVAKLEGNEQSGSSGFVDEPEKSESKVASSNYNQEQAYIDVSEVTSEQVSHLLDVQV